MSCQNLYIALVGTLALSGCNAVPDLAQVMTGTPSSSLSVKETERPIPRPDVVEGEGTGSEVAAVAPTGPGYLGRTVGSLGDVTEPGMWAATPLVDTEQTGRLEIPGGKSVAVTLYPNGNAAGSGTQVSLGALQALGVPLTDLPELLVYGL